MVFVVCHFSVHRPVIDVDVEEVHIYRHLNALTFDIFIFIYLVYNDNLSVSDRSHLIVLTYTHAVRYPEKEDHESHEEHRYDAQRIRNETPRNEAENKVRERCANEPDQQNCAVTVLMYYHINCKCSKYA